MNIGKPQRVITVEPLSEQALEEIPEEEEPATSPTAFSPADWSEVSAVLETERRD